MPVEGTCIVASSVNSSSHSSSHGGSGGVAEKGSSSSTTASKPLPPPTHTSCMSVVYIGDSTSDGESNPEYVPNRRLRAPAQLRKVGVKHVHMEVSGARSIVETFEGIPNGATVAYMPIAWYPLSTYSVVPVTFRASSPRR